MLRFSKHDDSVKGSHIKINNCIDIFYLFYCDHFSFKRTILVDKTMSWFFHGNPFGREPHHDSFEFLFVIFYPDFNSTQMSKIFYTYILECSDQSFYTGVTSNLENRLFLHESGQFEGFTSTRLPVKIVWFQEFSNAEEAIKTEKQIKGWSRAKKKALIANDWERVSFFSMRRSPNN